MPALLTRPPARQIDWIMAAQLRATGMGYQDIANQLNAVSGESVRKGLTRRGVTVAVRTATLSAGVRVEKERLSEASEATKLVLADSVLAHSQSIASIKPTRNIRNIKRIVEVLEPLARTAKIVYGWGEQSGKTAVNVNVLGSVSFDDLPMAGSTPERTLPDKPSTDQAGIDEKGSVIP